MYHTDDNYNAYIVIRIILKPLHASRLSMLVLFVPIPFLEFYMIRYRVLDYIH